MIFIQTIENDRSTNDVMDWLYYLNPKLNIIRVNGAADIKKVTLRINQEPFLKLKIDNFEITNNELLRSWYRRGEFKFSSIPINSRQKDALLFAIKSQDYLAKEQSNILNLINDMLFAPGKSINHFEDNRINKINTLMIASECGLQTPDSLITNDFDELLGFAKTHNEIITKSIANNNYSFLIEEDAIMLKVGYNTTLLSYKQLTSFGTKHSEKCPSPSLYQQYIPKKYELRIFFLKRKFYAMAIFSQANEDTKVDMRNEGLNIKNRCMPYNLPKQLQLELEKFIKKMNLSSGSIDMIVTPQNKYVFLEVNPIGQYQRMERLCNYDISKSIAETLVP